MIPYSDYSRIPLIINAALTGAIHSKDNVLDLPITINEVLHDIGYLKKMGVQIFHLHVRDNAGHPTMDHIIYRDLLQAIRDIHGDDIILSVSLSRANNKSKVNRLAVFKHHDLFDMCSVSLGKYPVINRTVGNSRTELKLIFAQINDIPIRPEFEVFSNSMALYAAGLHYTGKFPDDPYVNIFVVQPNTLLNRLQIPGMLPENAICSFGGIGYMQFPTIRMGMLLGHHVRTGLEDNTTMLVDGHKKGTNNYELVKQVIDFANSIGRPMMSVKDVRRRLNLL